MRKFPLIVVIFYFLVVAYTWFTNLTCLGTFCSTIIVYPILPFFFLVEKISESSADIIWSWMNFNSTSGVLSIILLYAIHAGFLYVVGFLLEELIQIIGKKFKGNSK